MNNTELKQQGSCEVIQDLIILYKDDVCSDASRDMVESHIATCEKCHDYFTNIVKKRAIIDDAANIKPSDEAFASSLAKVQKQINFRYAKATIAVLLILVIAAVSWVELIRDRIFILPTDSIQVSKMYELSNGNIFCELSFPEEVGLVTVTGMNVPEGEAHSDSDDGEYRIYMQKDFPLSNPYNKAIYNGKVRIIFPRQEKIATEARSYTHVLDEIMLTGHGSADRTSIWDGDFQLEAAPANIEKFYAEWTDGEAENILRINEELLIIGGSFF